MTSNSLIFLVVFYISCLLFSGCTKNDNLTGPRVLEPAVLPNDTIRATKSLTRPIAMLGIIGGTFQMGSADELNIHSVTLSSFQMSSTEITQEQYLAIMRQTPSVFGGDTSLTRPVENVTWCDAVLFCNELSKKAGKDTLYMYTNIIGYAGNGCTELTGIRCNTLRNGYRLPTEAEWEYAYRAGTITDYYWGGSYPRTTQDDSLRMDSNAVWFGNYRFITWPVASKKPNAWGLYDMAGNVSEWCNDWFDWTYPSTAQADPMGPDSGNYRVFRGGSFNYSDDYLRATHRDYGGNGLYWRHYDIGFRVVCRPPR